MELIKVLILSFSILSLTSCSSLTKKTNSSVNKESTEEKIPKIIKPNVRKIWIPDEISNNGAEYIQGHFKFVIERNSTWSK